MTPVPIKPEHADKVEPISGAHQRFTIRRHFEGYAYSLHSQVSQTTPRYRWLLLIDGILVDSADTRGAMVYAARAHGSDYLAEFDQRLRPVSQGEQEER